MWNRRARPVRYRLGEHDHIVEEILDCLYGPEDEFFKLRINDGNLYILRRSISADEWHLEPFRSVAVLACPTLGAGRDFKEIVRKAFPCAASSG